MERAMVSVIVCAYNGARFLEEALTSVLQGAWRDLELIVVDDGSTDGTPEVLAGIEDKRLRVIRQENQGASAALAVGLGEAREEYVALLDQDDRWHPEFLAALVGELHRRPEMDLVFSWFQVINEDGERMGLESRRFVGELGFDELLQDFAIGSSSNVVMRRSVVEKIGGPDRTLRWYYDLDLFLRIALEGRRNIGAVGRDLMEYRRRRGQMSGDWAGMQREWDVVLEKLRGRAAERVRAVEGVARSNMTRYFARLAYEGREYGAGLRLLGQAFGEAPGAFVADGRNWVTAAACAAGWALPAGIHEKLERLAGLRR
jgi:glycosyltransferase involved in cell wall biosynthesis